MKFSNKSFKIQAKISLPVFILMGSVCRLGAMETGRGDELGRHVSKNQVQENIFQQPENSNIGGRFSDGEYGNSSSSFIRAKMFGRGGGRSHRRDPGPDFGKEAVGRSSPVKLQDLQGQDDRTPTKKGYGSPFVSHIHMTNLPEGCSPGDVGYTMNPLNPEESIPNNIKTQLHKSPVRSKGYAVEERAAMKRDAAVDSAVVLRGERLNFEGTLVVHGDNASSLYDDDSIFAASREDKITLQILRGGEMVDVETSISDLLKPVEVTDASNDLTTIKSFFQYLSANEEGRVKEVRKLKKKDRCSDLSDEELVARLQSEAIAASPKIIDFFMNLVRQSKYDKSALTQYVKGTQDVVGYVKDLERRNGILNQQTVSLSEKMRSSFDAFNSAFSVFGLSLQEVSDVDGNVITRVQKTYSRLIDDHKRLEELNAVDRENYTKLASVNARYTQKMDEDRVLIDRLFNEKRELQMQLADAESREDAWKLREAELLGTIQSLREGNK